MSSAVRNAHVPPLHAQSLATLSHVRKRRQGANATVCARERLQPSQPRCYRCYVNVLSVLPCHRDSSRSGTAARCWSLFCRWYEQAQVWGGAWLYRTTHPVCLTGWGCTSNRSTWRTGATHAFVHANSAHERSCAAASVVGICVPTHHLKQCVVPRTSAMCCANACTLFQTTIRSVCMTT